MIKKIGLLLITLSVSVSAAAHKGSLTEQETFAKARQLFEQKKFEQAIELYSQIGTKSDRWQLALEEKAWAHLHLDQYDKALATAQTLTSPALTGLTSTEPFLMKAIIQLRICDYAAVFQTLKDFKSQKRTQVEAIQQLAKNGQNSVSRETLTKWMENPSDWKALGPNLVQMPQLFYHDVIMIREAKKKNLPAMEKRLKELALYDNNENYRILQKLNLIEVESMQRVHVASSFDRKQGQVVRDKYDMVFKDDKEVWVDEINSYQSTIDRCEKKSGRTM